MANYEATKYNFSGADLTGIEGIPTATIVPWSASSIPTGFLECNGAAVSRSTYSALFAIVGTTYGANTVASTGNVGGSTANATLSTAQLASHSHPVPATRGSPDDPNNIQFGNPRPGDPQPGTNTGSQGSGTGHNHNMSATFSGDSTSVVQPYIAVIYIIKT